MQHMLILIRLILDLQRRSDQGRKPGRFVEPLSMLPLKSFWVKAMTSVWIFGPLGFLCMNSLLAGKCLLLQVLNLFVFRKVFKVIFKINSLGFFPSVNRNDLQNDTSFCLLCMSYLPWFQKRHGQSVGHILNSGLPIQGKGQTLAISGWYRAPLTDDDVLCEEQLTTDCSFPL